MMGFGLIFTVLIVIALIFLINGRGQGNLFISPSTGETGRSALDIAKERYAQGDISKEEFERLRHDLTS